MNCSFNKQLMLEVNRDKKISLFHCCVLFDECIDRVDFAEYNNQSDIKAFLTEKYHVNPPEHNFHPCHSDCNGSEKCDFNNDLSPDFITVSHTCCNLRCKMCTTIKPESSDENKIMFDEYMYILRSIKGMKLSHLQISSAGEPFFRKYDVIDYIASLTQNDTKSLGFVTNATLLNSQDISEICSTTKKNGIHLSVVVSCDSLKDKVYNDIRGVNALPRVKENIDAFNEFGVLSCVNIVILPENIDELEDMYEYWASKGIRTRFIYPILHPEWDWMKEDQRVLNFKSLHSNNFSG